MPADRQGFLGSRLINILLVVLGRRDSLVTRRRSSIMTKDNLVYFLGAGAMAEAMIKGLLGQRVLMAKQIMAADVRVERCQELQQQYGILTDQTDGCRLLPQASVVVLSFKPKDLRSALSSYRAQLNAGQLVISILAGIPTSQLEKFLPQEMPVVRAMR
ncbi:MAG TPA: hypothetical protein DDZ53_09315, partial [Firmicutes bacterium]|nr:hypothetical protein [Bacillota bacterium]